MKSARLLLVGNGNQEHVGAHLHRAACDLGVQVRFVDSKAASKGPVWASKFNWWVRGHRPSRLLEFSEEIINQCRAFQPELLITTGFAPLTAATLRVAGYMGIATINFLTDDPWNTAHRAPWFMEGLPLYDWVFSPRQANLDDLRAAGCARVCYLPFGYAKHMHYPAPANARREGGPDASDVVFAGGADKDRVPWMAALIHRGYRVSLYGGYWDRYGVTKPFARGNADPDTLRSTMASAKVALSLVRKANRDGHAMRTFEVPAMQGCMLLEQTDDHRSLFGREGEAVLYFQSIPEMLEKVDWLLARPEERKRMAETAHRLIVEGNNTYHDRLKTILDTVQKGRVAA